MSRYYYDMHIHSCLSPCGDDDMTPNNIAQMATLKSLNILALTDHNSVKNCPAFVAACKKQGIIPIPGMEITTSEDIHMVCLFRTLEDAMRFGGEVEKNRVLIENRKDIFGNQLILDKDDGIVGEERYMLPNATNLSLEEAAELVRKMNGLCYPAHIDRPANGIIAVLGDIPVRPEFTCVEFYTPENEASYREKYPALKGKKRVISSDAHYLWDINEAENWFDIDDEPYSSALVIDNLFAMLEHCEEK